MKQVLKRVSCSILAFVLLLGSIPFFAYASDNQTVPLSGISNEGKTITRQYRPTKLLPSNRTLFSKYAEQMLYGNKASTYGTAGRSRLNSSERAMYDALKEKIEAVAQNGGSTVFSFPDISGVKTTWLASEYDADDVINLYYAYMSNAIDALLEDCPFDLYWFDKTCGVGFSLSYYSSGSAWIFSDFVFEFPVCRDYASGTNYVTKDVTRVKNFLFI